MSCDIIRDHELAQLQEMKHNHGKLKTSKDLIEPPKSKNGNQNGKLNSVLNYKRHKNIDVYIKG